MDKNISKEINIISAHTIVEGKIKAQGNLRIDGKVFGDLVVTENIAVGLSGEVEGNISAKNIDIAGKVKGNVSVSDKIVLESKAFVHGDLKAAKLVVDEGANFNGKISMSENRLNNFETHSKN